MKISEAKLRKTEWWWHDHTTFDLSPTFRAVALTSDQRGRLIFETCWKPVQAGAYAYELVRRLHRDKKLPSFRALPDYKAVRLSYYNGPTEVGSMRFKLMESGGLKPTCDPETISRPVQFDLAENDSQLEIFFWSFIKMERFQREIEPRRSNEGRNNNPVSWRWPELMDLDHFRIRALVEDEKRTLRKARIRAERECKKIFRLLGIKN